MCSAGVSSFGMIGWFDIPRRAREPDNILIPNDITGGCAIIKSMDSVVAARKPGDGVGPDVGPSKSAA